MNSHTDPKNVLLDVIAMSRELCTHPIQGRLAYATKENFLGRIVDGYLKDSSEICLLTRTSAEQLCHVQNILAPMGLSLFIFDAFRPLRAVRDFALWSQQPCASEYERERKKIHYPQHEKHDLSRLGYVADTVSSHCFGHAVDLSIFCLKTKQLLDMGSVFDYFGKNSHLDAPSELIGDLAYNSRRLLTTTMQRFGFIPYAFEWWHFTYQMKEVDLPMDMVLQKR